MSRELAMCLGSDDVLITPCGNHPMRIRCASYTEMRNLVDGDECALFKPPLLLTQTQQQIKNERGTILLLGRSGTGKTVCLCTKMRYDYNQQVVATPEQSPQYLFVCRSSRLCQYVNDQMQSESTEGNITFMTFDKFVDHMEGVVTGSMVKPSCLRSYPQQSMVDCHKFVELFPHIRGKQCVLSPFIVWTHIKSFIKGSIEAVIQHSPLTLQQYTDVDVFSESRCRLPIALRRTVFAIFERYEDILIKQGMWDEAGRTMDLLVKSELQRLSKKYDKVYVDEVQDNTQAEIVLFFLAAGMDTQALFLAGDPAQAVVEGVDFRFEDVRSIVYKLSGGTQCINRPLKLTTNYRSHSGILE
jgi:hypothetical protein